MTAHTGARFSWSLTLMQPEEIGLRRVRPGTVMPPAKHTTKSSKFAFICCSTNYIQSEFVIQPNVLYQNWFLLLVKKWFKPSTSAICRLLTRKRPCGSRNVAKTSKFPNENNGRWRIVVLFTGDIFRPGVIRLSRFGKMLYQAFLSIMRGINAHRPIGTCTVPP